MKTHQASTGSALLGGHGPARKLTLLFIAALTIMSGATISPSLPGIEQHFAAVDDAALLTRLVLTLPALLIAFCAPVAGSLADRFGRRPLLIASIVLYGFAGTSGLVLDSLEHLLIGRALLGVAVAGTMTTATALIGDYFSGSERNRFMGLQAAFVGLGGLIFLTGGGLFADYHWRAPFAIYGLAFVLLPAVALFINEPSRSSIDVSTPDTATALRHPWLVISVIFIVAGLNGIAFYLVPTQFPFYLHSIGIEAPSQAGLAIGILSLASAAVSLAYNRLRAYLSITGLFASGFGLMAVGYGFVILAESYIPIVAAITMTGIGMGIIMPNLTASIMTVAPATTRGRAAGGLTASLFLGTFLSPLISQPWVDSMGFIAAFRNMAVLLLVMAIAAAVTAKLYKVRSIKNQQRHKWQDSATPAVTTQSPPDGQR